MVPFSRFSALAMLRCMRIEPEALYHQLGHLVATVPDLSTYPLAPETREWLGRAAALIEAFATPFLASL